MNSAEDLLKLVTKQRDIEQQNREKIDKLLKDKKAAALENVNLEKQISKLEDLKRTQNSIFQQLVLLESIQSAESQGNAASGCSGFPPSSKEEPRKPLLPSTRPEETMQQYTAIKTTTTSTTQIYSATRAVSAPSPPPGSDKREWDRTGRIICSAFRHGDCRKGDRCELSHAVVPYPYCHHLNYKGKCNDKKCRFLHEYYKGVF